MKRYLLGFDIGGTKCAVVLGELQDRAVTICERLLFQTECSVGHEQVLDKLEQAARRIVSEHGIVLGDIGALGISCGGPLDSRRGVILGPPNLPGWNDVHITGHFENRLGIRARLQNDANACAMAEWMWGAGQGCRNMVFLTFGTGLGAGLILDGRLYSGTNGLAGEVGHIRLAEQGPVGYGKYGSFEGFCSGGGIARLAGNYAKARLQQGQTVDFCKSEDQLEQITAQVVVESARVGDPAAREVLQTVAHYLGRGLSILIDVLNPEAIVIGSVFARAHDLLWLDAKRVIETEALSLSVGACRVVPAALGEAIGDYACLSVALTSVEEK